MIGADAIRGHIDLILLSILATRDSYAYELSRTISGSSDGLYPIKQTTLYTALKRLETRELLDSYDGISDTGRSRTYYRITDEGSTQLEQLRQEWQQTRDLVDHFAKGHDPS